MRLKWIFFCWIIVSSFSVGTAQKVNDQSSAAVIVGKSGDGSDLTWAEKLGYPSNKIILILHADDIGMCEEANVSAQIYLSQDHIQSAAAMPPCPAFEKFIEWAKDHPDKDLGLHLTLTSEWKTYRWGPVSNPEQVPGLIDPEGKLWHSVPEVVAHASAAEIEKEIRAQVEKSLNLGYRPDHIDTHMGTLFAHPSYTAAYIRVAEEYNIPAMVIDIRNPIVFEMLKEQGYPATPEMVQVINNYQLPKLDYFYSIGSGLTYQEKCENFFQLVETWRPGLTEIIFHPSEDTDQLKSITNSWQQRVWEAKMFSDPDVMEFLRKKGVIFTNWKEIMQRFEMMKAKQ